MTAPLEHMLRNSVAHGNESPDQRRILPSNSDVGGHHKQCTRLGVQDVLPLGKKPVPRVHYRLVVEDIGLPLSEFRSFGELAGIFADALKGTSQSP